MDGTIFALLTQWLVVVNAQEQTRHSIEYVCSNLWMF